jgi:hypothetical protein
LAQLVVGEGLHSHEQAALRPFTAGPLLDTAVYFPPAAQIKITDAEVGAVSQVERLAQVGQQVLVDVVVDIGHGLLLFDKGFGHKDTLERQNAFVTRIKGIIMVENKTNQFIAINQA